jgi:hypothetical protein
LAMPMLQEITRYRFKVLHFLSKEGVPWINDLRAM